MNSTDTVSRLRRAQMHLHTTEGELVTSTLLAFDNVENEYITIDTLVWLFGFDTDTWAKKLLSLGISLNLLHGVQWVNVVDILPLLDLTSG